MRRFEQTLVAIALSTFVFLGFAGSANAKESRFSGTAQLDLTNAYYFRGILNESNGLIAEPWGELYFSLYSAEDGFIRDITLGAGVWLSIHSEDTLAANEPESLYEADYYPLLSIDLAGGFNLTTTYYFYTSPNGAWTETVDELNFKLAWDDSDASPFPVQPWVNVAIETHSTSLGNNSGSGLQLGIEPTLFENDHISVSLPVELGLAIDDYYEGVKAHENTFGYANLGLGMSVPITDTFAASLGFKYFLFGDDLQTVNGGHGGHGVGTASLTAEF